MIDTDQFADPFAVPEEAPPPPPEGSAPRSAGRSGMSIPDEVDGAIDALPDDPGEERAGNPSEADVLRDRVLELEYENARLRALSCLPPDNTRLGMPEYPTEPTAILSMERLDAIIGRVTLEKLYQQQTKSNSDRMIQESRDRLKQIFIEWGGPLEATIAQLIAQEKGKRKSIQRLGGVVGFRSVGGEVQIRPGDEPRAKALAWAEENAPETICRAIDLKVFKTCVLPELFERVDENSGEVYHAAPEFLVVKPRQEDLYIRPTGHSGVGRLSLLSDENGDE